MTRLRLVAPIVCLVLLAGCMVNEQAKDDTDGDYLSGEIERTGYNLTLTLQPMPCFGQGPLPIPIILLVTSEPNDFDTDFDGLDDGEEALWGGNPRSKDTDGDGLEDKREVELNNDKSRVQISGSLELFKVDSDDDCLPDGQEVNGTDVPGIGVRQTDPGTKDTDHDGLSDPHEIFRSRTDPLSNNTDGDDASDFLDINPTRDVNLEVTFTRLLLKGSGQKVQVRFDYALEIVGGALTAPPSVGTFEASEGQSTPVPSAQSPGLVNTRDESGTQRLHLQFYASRGDGAVIDLHPGPGADVSIELDPNALTWTSGDVTGQADGSVQSLETTEAKVEFQLTVR